MENNNQQNDTFGKLFDAIKNQKNPTYKSNALVMLKLNDENFIKLFNDTKEITGDQEDVNLCFKRANELGIKTF